MGPSSAIFLPQFLFFLFFCHFLVFWFSAARAKRVPAKGGECSESFEISQHHLTLPSVIDTQNGCKVPLTSCYCNIYLPSIA